MKKNNLKIYQANYSEKKKILKFIKIHWKKNHVLLKSDELFNYYYREKKKLNFIIARDDLNVVGLLGYIKNKKYNFINNSLVWTSILKALDDYPLLGVKLVQKLVDKFKKSDIGCMGNNVVSQNLFKLIGFDTGKLNHYYLINNNINHFRIIKFKNKKKLTKKPLELKVDYKFLNKDNISQIKNYHIQDKNYKFILNKYILNKFYNYKVIIILNKNNKIQNLFVFRIVRKNKSSCIRVVDYLGKFVDFKKNIFVFNELLIKYKSEYIDFYTSIKISKKLLKHINKNNYNKDIVVPNYFEPYIKSNTLIRYGVFYRSKKEKYNLFKGEGDAERPSEISNN